ncbi:hypothetical protein AHAS_Ahas17G0033500 [Arachis hypogaea]
MGFILQGTWIIQIGLALFSGWVTQGCSLHQLSRGNYTLRCKVHMDYHRTSALATLQFNCQLALMVVLSVGAYSVISARNGGSLESSSAAASYRPIGFAEMQQLENSMNFTLDSDDDDGEERQKGTVVEHGNGLRNLKFGEEDIRDNLGILLKNQQKITVWILLSHGTHLLWVQR